MFELNQNEQRSYQEKYDKLIKAKVVLDFKRTKKILFSQFSLSDAQADSILKKVFYSSNSNELNKEGFFTVLRYVQCLQNQVNIETCNINTIKLQFPLRVNSKSNLKKSFQTPSPEDMLDKSMIALQNLQNLVKEPASQEKQKSQIHSDKRENQICQIQNVEGNDDKVEHQQKIINEIPQLQKLINNGYQQQIILPTVEKQNSQLIKSYKPKITQFGLIDINQNDEQQQNFDSITSNQQYLDTNSNQNQIAQLKDIKEDLPDIIEIDENEDEQIIKPDQSKDIYVWISGYQSFKDGPLSQTYQTYNVCSEICTDQFNRTYTKYQVQRRFTDFEMLQQYFTKSKLGDIIPSLPEKKGIIGSLKNMVVENLEFIKERQEKLQLFLQFLTKYKEDQIYLQFLTNEKKFDVILKELRYLKEENQDEDIFLPDPDEFTRKQKLKEIMVGKQLSDLLDYFKNNKEIVSKFQEEYRQVQQHFKTLENKKLELINFKQCLNQFYDPIDKFSSSNQLQTTQIISDENIRCYQETQKLFQANYTKHQNLIMNQVTQIEFQLNSMTYSYEQIQKQIYKWFSEKKRLRDEKIINKQEIQKIDIEEGRLQSVISKTNETLLKLIKQITDDLKGLLKDFVKELIQI